MNLLHAAGILRGPTTEEVHSNEVAARRLLEEAADFLRAGGVVTIADWKDLEDVERAALVQAGGIVAAERAARIGAATQGPAGAAAVLAEADGGEALAQVQLRETVSRVAAAAQGQSTRGPA